jgi:hypothetical protein
MGRLVKSGQSGRPQLGAITSSGSVSSNNITLSTIGTNADLILDPNGTGLVKISKDLELRAESGVGDLRFYNSANTFYVGFKAGSISANRVWVLPGADGTSGQVLQTDGSGNFSFGNKTVAIGDQTASSSTFYPLLGDATSGSTTTVYSSSTRLTFVPSTGVMALGGNQTASNTTSGTLRVTGGVGITGSCFIGATMSAATVTETSSITLKENIKPLTGALEAILQLNSKIYDRIDGSSKNEAGLIAEEVEKIIPYVVQKDGDGNPASIAYSRLVAYLIESIKELKSEINDLKIR